MTDSIFSAAMSAANSAFGAVTGEEFQLIRGGTPGTYMALSIDDLVASSVVSPGGLKAENTTAIWIDRDVKTASGVEQGTVLVVRSNRVRVNTISDDGDNALLLQCAAVGVGLK